MLKRKILLAEDDEDDQHFFIDFLQSRNDIVLMPIVENGIALVELLEKIKTDELPDYIILDQNMPKRNGLQTLQILKKESRYAHIPVMIYSTYTDDQLIKKGTELGASMVMTKPLTKEGYDQLVNAFFMERN